MDIETHVTRAEAAEQLIREIDAWPWDNPNAEADLVRLGNLIKGKLLTRARMKIGK